VQYSKRQLSGQEPQPASDAAADDRRRLGRIVHDDRGNAVVQWEEAPPDYERPVLEIESSGIQPGLQHRLGADQLSLDVRESFDPYASSRPLEHKAPQKSTGNTTRTDLRKLSEWIKLMRELEERKQRGDADDEDVK
jgi:hypothetical protein